MEHPASSTPSQDPASTTDDAALDAAIGPLRQYNVGSARGTLVPLDELVARWSPDPARRQRLAARLADCLRPGHALSAVAREFVCGRLAVIGSDESVDALEAMLADPDAGEAARMALTAIADEAALAALRKAAQTATDARRAGLFQSLGARRDARSVDLLARALDDADSTVAAAAAWALGEIGNGAAGKALRKAIGRAAGHVGPVLADACVRCVESLKAAGEPGDAASLKRAVEDAQPPRHVRDALSRAVTSGR
ncbi:MAG TPA: HEAT repeat domain-containing protein [Verrucomicrobiota bacterium]|nr:HEAT repeat domain-containing protein [Verrucomicrobiota bacterium]HNU52853.1 HEAT repeat domain-containing protein [Verrucomicrobiota bacterium]